MKRIVKIIIFLFLILCVVIAVYITIAWIPVKYAVREEDFVKYGKFILLKGNYDTGTGWSKVGDETGFYNTDKVYEVWIEGKVKPPKISTSFAGYQKVYLCKVEEVPELKDIKGIMCQVYKIIEWYPVYPVIRDPAVLPEWIYPTEFINIYDMSDEPVW